MSTDLLSGSYTMEGLRKTYGNFMVPDFCIKVEGSQLKSSSKASRLFLEDVKLKLSTDAAGALSFTVVNAYDLEGRCFFSDVKSKLLPGKIVTAEFGYAGHLTELFKGYISSVSYEYNDTPAISVTAMDLLCLMQENTVLKRTFSEMTYTDMFKKVMESYKMLCPDSAIKTDSAGSTKTEETQKGDDFSFIKEVLCAKAGRDFCVLGGRAYFVDSEKKKSAVLTLEWGKDILSFSYESNYLDKCIQVNLADPKSESEPILYQKKVSGKNQKKVLAAPTIKNISREASGTSQEAMVQAKKAAKEELKNSVRCSGSCIGIPYIVPGRCLTISKLDSDLDGTYEIISVDHVMSAEGYVTQFELGGKS